MKKATTLQELLKPPFVKYGNSITDGNGIKILTVNGLIDNFIGNIGDNYPDILTVTAAALNEQWEREFGEPKRWIIKVAELDNNGNTYTYAECPDCGFEHMSNKFNYCPSCGGRMQPLESSDLDGESCSPGD